MSSILSYLHVCCISLHFLSCLPVHFPVMSSLSPIKHVLSVFQYVVLPTRRSTAEGFQLLVSHALGDAGSPYLIGVVSIFWGNRTIFASFASWSPDVGGFPYDFEQRSFVQLRLEQVQGPSIRPVFDVFRRDHRRRFLSSQRFLHYARQTQSGQSCA